MLLGLTQAGVEFVVIGGVASVAHGSPLRTNDLDLCYRPTAANIERLAALLGGWQAFPRNWDRTLSFALDVQTFASNPFLTLETNEGLLDLTPDVQGVGDFNQVYGESELVSALDVSFRALSLPALIRSKRAAGRGKDKEHLLILEALQVLTERQDKPAG